MLGCDEAQVVRQARKSGGVAVGCTHAAARKDVEAGQAPVLGDGDEAQIVGIDVDVIARRHRDRGLELAG